MINPGKLLKRTVFVGHPGSKRYLCEMARGTSDHEYAHFPRNVKSKRMLLSCDLNSLPDLNEFIGKA